MHAKDNSQLFNCKIKCSGLPRPLSTGKPEDHRVRACVREKARAAPSFCFSRVLAERVLFLSMTKWADLVGGMGQ
jgi:hypothetical protein